MEISLSQNRHEWDEFLKTQTWSPFLQSWTMGEVYRITGQTPYRLVIRLNDKIEGICQAVVVPARRGRHLAVHYGPVISPAAGNLALLVDYLKKIAADEKCAFIRLSPFWPKDAQIIPGSVPAPLHLLAEHVWYLNIKNKNEDEIFKNMRQNTRNLIRRASREGVIIEASKDPVKDLPVFIALHEETRRRHNFTPYTNNFFKAQIEFFSEEKACTLYLARYQNEVIAASIHMHFGGETSYHHGASTHKFNKIPASYLLQWTAICDALKRRDNLYSFWGIAPEGIKKHPFAGVTTFKRGFGGELLELTHCMDIPINYRYYFTYGFETIRKWRRGF